MGKKILFGIIIAFALLATGCGVLHSQSVLYKQMKESEDYILPIVCDDDDLEEKVRKNIFDFEDKYGPEYQTDEWKVDGVESPGGILCREQDVLITDRKNDQLIVTDYEGNVIKTVGGSGNGPLEFLSPSDLTLYDNKIYIIDQKNYRVQILDADLNYLDEVETRIADQNDPEFVFEHISVNKNGIYLNGFSFFNDHVYLYQSNKKDPVVIGKNFYGPLFCYEDNIYAVNTNTKIYNKKSDTMGYRNGLDNYLMLIDDTQKDFSGKINLLPTIDATGLFMDQEGIYVSSPSHSSLFAFDKNGSYKYTVAVIKGMEGEEFSKVSVDKMGRYYVTASEKGKIFRCSPKE